MSISNTKNVSYYTIASYIYIKLAKSEQKKRLTTASDKRINDLRINSVWRIWTWMMLSKEIVDVIVVIFEDCSNSLAIQDTFHQS